MVMVAVVVLLQLLVAYSSMTVGTLLTIKVLCCCDCCSSIVFVYQRHEGLLVYHCGVLRVLMQPLHVLNACSTVF
jgi:hypothetical protein